MGLFDRDEVIQLRRIADELEELICIVRHLIPRKANRLVVTFPDSKGNNMAATVTLQVGQKTTATAHEFAGTVELPLAGAISWASSDPSIATVDPTSGLVTAVAAGQATITATDAANGLSGSGIVSDTPVVATSLTVDFGPVS